MGNGGCKSKQAINNMNVTKAALNSVVLMYPTSENKLFSMMGWIKLPSEVPVDTKVIAKVRLFLK